MAVQRLMPVDEPARSLNDQPHSVTWSQRARRLAVRFHRQIRPDAFGLAQFGATGAYVYGVVSYFGASLGCLIVGASVFLTAVVLESLGGK